jgi:feruloyl esterase
MPALAVDCGQLASRALLNARVVSSKIVSPETSVISSTLGTSKTLPHESFCKVSVLLAPTPDSKIWVEIWLPDPDRWNGKFKGVGNGGLGGSIDFSALASGLAHGYATAATDTGHKGNPFDGEFALHHPEKIADYGYRATHLTATTGQRIVEEYYGRRAAHSYFEGCSQGGQEALMEAERFPQDYDGIIAGDPDYNQTHHEVGAHLWIPWVLFGERGATISKDQAEIIGRAVLDACDDLDGVKDGVLEDPRQCHFDPVALQCKTPKASHCLTVQQVASVRSVWEGPRKYLGTNYYPGLERGGEAETWIGWIASSAAVDNFHSKLGLPFFKYFVFADPTWDFRQFNFSKDPMAVDKAVSIRLNATSAALLQFKNRGGKLIQYHGYSDPDVPPLASIEYYQEVLKVVGTRKDVDDFYRLFMVPGMGHCRGGPGANTFDMLQALEAWVEHGRSPTHIVATKYVDDDLSKPVVRTHPLCPYPQVAQYRGGNPARLQNFECTDIR